MTFKESGDVYSGEFENSLFHGSGRLIYANGDEYAGEFANGQKHGAGQLTIGQKGSFNSTDQAVAEGMQSAAQAASLAQGDLTEMKGTYLGDFVEDQMHGNGTFIFPGGSEFIGRFAHGL